MNIERAKKRIAKLQRYIDLTESYKTYDFETYVIKEYAITGSLYKVVDKMNELGFKINGKSVDKDDVVAVIKKILEMSCV